MILKGKLIFLLYILPLTLSKLRPISSREKKSAGLLPKRIHQLMVNYNDRSVNRITEITSIRAKYETSPHFELGYVVSEILERYRKMVGHVKKPIDYTSDVVYDAIKQTEMVQKLFLEIYHMVNMVNEIPRKYSHMPEFTHHDTVDTDKIIEAQNRFEENQKRREKEKKRKLKEMRKERELYVKGEIDMMKSKAKKPRNKWWPIDYGWEIDYYW